MESIQVFLKINKPGLNNEWNERINAELKAFNGINDVVVIEKNESSEAQINIGCDIEKASIDEIELILTNTGAAITEINIHFPSSISGVASAYGVGAIALKLEEGLKTVKGILKAGISADGEIKILLDPKINNKQEIIEQALKIISSIKTGSI